MPYTTSGAAVIRAGSAVSEDIIDDTGWVLWISGAIGFVNASTRKNWSDNYATLNDDTKGVLHEAATPLVAINAIQYDMSGYTSRSEAIAMIDVLRDRSLQAISILRDIKTQTFVDGS